MSNGNGKQQTPDPGSDLLTAHGLDVLIETAFNTLGRTDVQAELRRRILAGAALPGGAVPVSLEWNFADDLKAAYDRGDRRREARVKQNMEEAVDKIRRDDATEAAQGPQPGISVDEAYERRQREREARLNAAADDAYAKYRVDERSELSKAFASPRRLTSTQEQGIAIVRRLCIELGEAILAFSNPAHRTPDAAIMELRSVYRTAREAIEGNN
jgi:hypothetical protein